MSHGAVKVSTSSATQSRSVNKERHGDMRLAGRTAIVAGAAQGLGFAVARRFVAEGARVVVADINGAKAETAAAGLSAEGGTAIACTVDVGDEAQVQSMVELALGRFGAVDILVNNAGGSGNTPAVEIED